MTEAALCRAKGKDIVFLHLCSGNQIRPESTIFAAKGCREMPFGNRSAVGNPNLRSGPAEPART